MTELFTHLSETPGAEDWYSFLFVLGGLVAFVAVAESLRAALHWSPEVTRKLVHVSVGIAVFFSPSIFTASLPVVILALFFIVVNFAAVRLDLLRGIYGTGRRSYGTVFYPLAFLLLVIVFWHRSPLILSLSILVLALADAAAALVGEGFRNPGIFFITSDKKSVAGSLTMFCVSFVVLFFGIRAGWSGNAGDLVFAFSAAGAAAANATVWEAVSSRGLDNLTVPLSVALVLSFYLLPDGRENVHQFTIGVLLGIVIALASFRVKALTLSGAAATFLLASVLFGFGGWKWTVPILAFFILSSALSKRRSAGKSAAEGMFEKSGTRDLAQVFANGGVAGILVVLAFIFPSVDFFPIFLGSIAAVNADTWGTEIGLAANRPPVLITNWKRVEAGTSGGVTYPGLMAGIAGSTVIALSGLPWTGPAIIVAAVIAAGIGGSLIDSLIGATLQAGYRCPVCGKETERRSHCRNQPTVHRRGIVWIDNDVVNWVCASSGAVIMVIFLASCRVLERT